MAEIPKLMLMPLREGYDFSLGRGVTNTETAVGLPRQRRDSVGKAHRASVTYRCKRSQWQYLMAFLRAYAGLPFLAMLELDDIDPQWYECSIVSENIGGNLVGAKVKDASFELVAKPILYPVDTDIAIATIYAMTDGQIDRYFSLLEKLVNEDLPKIKAK